MECGFVSGGTGLKWKSATGYRSGAVCDRRSKFRCAMDGSNSGGNGGNKDQPPSNAGKGGKEELGLSIAGVIDQSFQQVWLTLATAGVGDAYYAALQTFILGVMAAFKRGYSIPALNLELSMSRAAVDLNALSKEDKEIAASIQQHEQRHRSVWISLVYLTLQQIKFPSQGPKTEVPNSDVLPALKVLVDEVTRAYQKGFSFDGLKMEMSLNRKKGAVEVGAAASSIRSQWMRIVYMTNKLVPSNPTNKDKKGGSK